MARATTKADLTSSANEQFNKMWKLIDCMTKSQQEAAFAEEMATVGKETHWSRDKNLRDVLVHLYEWHQLLLSWIKANLNGEYQTFLPTPRGRSAVQRRRSGTVLRTAQVGEGRALRRLARRRWCDLWLPMGAGAPLERGGSSKRRLRAPALQEV